MKTQNVKIYVTTNTNNVTIKKIPMFVSSGIRFDQGEQRSMSFGHYMASLKRSIKK